jgi:hypothetical protein
MLGLILGAILGLVDGLSAWRVPEVRPAIVGIIIGSTVKGVLTGILIGFFAKRFRSLPLGILFGGAVGLFLAFLVAAIPGENGEHYWFEIMMPGAILGIIIGYAHAEVRYVRARRSGRPPRRRSRITVARVVPPKRNETKSDPMERAPAGWKEMSWVRCRRLPNSTASSKCSRGSWAGEEKIHPSPWDPQGGPARGPHGLADRARRVLPDHGLRRGARRPGLYRGHGVYGWDPQDQCYTMHWFDGMGSIPKVWAKGRWEGDVLTFQHQHERGHSRYVYELKGNAQYRFRIESSQDGKAWATFMEGTYKKK